MAALEGYQLDETLFRSVHSVVRRGRRLRDGRAVVIKSLTDPHPAQRSVVRLRHEHRLLQDLGQNPGLPEACAFEHQGATPYLVIEDIGAVSLSQLLTTGPLSLRAFLELSIQILDTLRFVHEGQIVHKDVTPGNVVWNPELRRAQLIDFGIATRVSREVPALLNRGLLEGTLAYMSPEQTGRTNHSLDYRSDLYSLGATLFHAVAGQRPFPGDDFMELVHCHIARQPPLLHEIRSEIPPVVSQIVNRLLAKAPEDRYQSAYAARVDFQRCLESLDETFRIDDFEIGQKDVSDRFVIPQRLYGRSEEIGRLLGVFARTSLGSKELALVAGPAGVGKSALVRELYRPIVEKRGYFVSGKCDQLDNVPFNCLIQACGELIRQILTEPEREVAAWRARLTSALGPNGGIVVEVIPDVERIIGKQPPLPKLPPIEAENRFNLTFERFLRAFSDPAHPLAIFLDDLQWADNPTLKLVQRLMTDQETRYLLVIGAYRPNEVDALHPLQLCLKDLAEAEALVQAIELGPLEADHIQGLLADTLHCTPEEVGSLGQICRNKTEGNPFFLGQFLLDLHHREAFRFEAARARWTWSLREIEEMEVANNVVDLLAAKLHTLPEATQTALQLAACVGNTFDPQTLALVRELGPREIARELWPGVEAGLVIPLGTDYHFVGPEGEDAAEVEGVCYRFLHDRVQQAAYSLISAEDREQAHRHIGRILLEHLDPERQEERLFELVGQLNRGPRSEDPAERTALAELNLRAGRKAVHSAAFQPGLVYLERGIGLVGETGWQEDYERTLALHNEAASAAYRGSLFERSDELVEVVLREARDPLDAVDASETRVLALVVQKRQKDAIAAALAFLESQGIKFPAQPTKLDVAVALADTKLALFGKKLEDLADLPEMAGAKPLAAMRLLVSISSSAYLTRQDLFPLLILRQMSLSARSGVIPHTAYALSTYGIILTGVLGDIEGGVRCGRTALKLLGRLPRVGLECRTHFCHETFLRPWREHAKHAWEALFRTYEIGIETGDVEYAAWSSMTRVMFAYFLGRNLAEVDEECLRWTSLQKKFRHDAAHDYTRIYWQAIQNLRGLSEDPCRLVGEVYDEDARLPHHLEVEDGFALCSINLHRLVLAYHFGDRQQALTYGDAAERHLENYLSFPLQTVFYLYDALNRISVAGELSASKRRPLLKRARAHLSKLRGFCKHAPVNHLHRVELIEAELARLKGDALLASEGYERAIKAARDNEFVNDEALAYECAASFHSERGNEVMARAYLGEAKYAYERWGAQAKVDQLEAQLPGAASADKRHTSSYTGTSEILDLESVVKTSQAISGEIVLEDLLRRVMLLLIENAGAGRGVLVLIEESGPRLVAEASTEDEEVSVGEVEPLEQSQRVSPAIVGYVLRTGEAVLLADATQVGEFVSDPYVQRAAPRSVLCAPVVRQGEVTGAIYLENNLTPGVFTPARVELIQLLSSQAAISLENAKLYASVEAATRELEGVNRTLEARVLARTDELRTKNLELGEALERVQAMQDRIVTQEKLASLGALTAGIAHEIKNPLNFVNNFASLSVELAEELREELSPLAKDLPESSQGLINELLGDLHTNAAKINRYGQQADGIVRGMLEHSRPDGGRLEGTDLNALVSGHLDRLLQSEQLSELEFQLRVERTLDPELGKVPVQVRSLGKVLGSVFDNACYAVREKRNRSDSDYTPTLTVTTRPFAVHGQPGGAELRIRDNGTGISPDVAARIFSPFFTTKPAGEGVGFGLSVAHDVVTKVHGGELLCESEPGAWTELVIRLPADPSPASSASKAREAPSPSPGA
jgi:predicted ATPase/signal transduction histidine kinase